MAFMLLSFWYVKAADDELDYTTYRTVDLWSFNEFRYKIVREYFKLKETWEVDWKIDSAILASIKTYAKTWANYLPDNLSNEKLYNTLSIAIDKWLKYPESNAAYLEVLEALKKYLDNPVIDTLKGSVTATPAEWNAPFNVTLRANVTDPSGSVIPKQNYVWWISEGGKKVILWTWPSLNHTFTEEWNYTVFVDVKSTHKNNEWYNDVLPWRWKEIVKVNEKIASLIIKVNWDQLRSRDELKFTPDEARYGLVFDATSSTPTWGTQFVKTTWDFGNGIEKEYDSAPKIERIIYNKEWDYTVELKLKTNLWKSVTRKFVIKVHDPIATISVTPETWFIGDKFTFSAKSSGKDDDLIYNWEIIDLSEDKVIFTKNTKVFNYEFTKKWQFNVKLKVWYVSSNDEDVDVYNLVIDSRAPTASFTSSIPKKNKPNRVLLDATNSFDPDFWDNGNLKYSWSIAWENVLLEDPNYNWSIGYYTFDSIWDHSVTLKVEDPDWRTDIVENKVKVDSTLSVDFSAVPRAIKLGDSIRFKADSPEAKLYEWNFDDGNNEQSDSDNISHVYEESWVYDVELKVRDSEENTNSYKKVVYVWDGDNPVAILNVKVSNSEIPAIQSRACSWQDAYIVDRANPVTFDASDSIDVNGKNTGLDYSIKLDSKPRPVKTVSYKFDELGCFPVKLVVTSKKTRSSASTTIWVKVVNLKPTLSGLSVDVLNSDTDPVVVDVSAVWSKDLDWVITSYLWYYTTDIDLEPQWFKATTSPSTTYVLPKISWEYSFYVVMTDDNDSRVSSEELWRKASVSLIWSETNVPLVKLIVNDTSIYLWEEISLKTEVKNYLWRAITQDVKYLWDFDWDGFYDQETTTSNVTHTFDSPWEFIVKVKVKYKWYSNTRTVRINVENKLNPNFEYISIWSKVIFINKTLWSYDEIVWDMWDWERVEGKDNFTYVYNDNKNSHTVKLLVKQGDTTKKREEPVYRNVKNLIESRTKEFAIFSVPELKDDKIILESKQDEAYIYFSSKLTEIEAYSIDVDINNDSDLNWNSSDDRDIKKEVPWIFAVKLNDSREQTIRLSLIDADWVEYEWKDILIEKLYVKQEISDSEITFEWVTDDEKQKLDRIKSLVSNFSENDVKNSYAYLYKLKEEWSDNYEKTQIINDFIWYLYWVEGDWSENINEVVDLLSSLLVEHEEDKSDQNVSFVALKNLTPDDISCSYSETDYSSCKDYIVTTLETIKQSTDVETNKVLGKQVLEIIATNEKMSLEDKENYKAILSALVYSWQDNIPDDEKNQIIQDSEQVQVDTNSWWSLILSIVITIVYIFWWVLWLFALILAWFFIYYNVSNKDKSKGFSDFVSEKLGFGEVKNATKVVDNDVEDILSTIDEKSEEKQELKTDEKSLEKAKDKKIETVPTWLSGAWSKIKDNLQEEDIKITNNAWVIWEEKIENNKVIDKKEEVKTSKKEEKVPDWLKGSFKDNLQEEDIKITNNAWAIWEEKSENNKVIEKKEEVKIPEKEEKVPDWLKGSFDNSNLGTDEKKTTEKQDIAKDLKIDKKVEEVKQDKEEVSKSKEENLDELTKVDEKVPDWLKGSLSEKKDDKQQERKPDKKEKIPDWLKGSLNERKNDKQEEKEVDKKEKTWEESPKAEIKKDESVKEKKENIQEKKESLAPKEAVKETERKEVKQEKKETIGKNRAKKDAKNPKTENKSEDKKSDKKEKNTKDENWDLPELWDNGMDVPDWLKTDESDKK